MKPYWFVGCIVLGLTIASVWPQNPAPIVVPAANAAAAPAAANPRPAAADPAVPYDPQAISRLLQEMQTTNAETLKKQEAALATLDELQKAAEELRIFSKRG
jgi:hypothetical protein